MCYYIGMDVHKQFSFVTVMNKEGHIMDEQKLSHHNPKDLLDYFSAYRGRSSVAMEATRNWYWLVDLLEDFGLQVKLVHVKKARIIAESTIKTDRLDARILAHLDRCRFLPEAYIADRHTRSQRELLRYHLSLIRIQTSVKNKIHGLLAKHNIQHQFSDLFGQGGRLFLKELKLPGVFQCELNGYLNLLEHLKATIEALQKKIRQTCVLSSSAQLLMSVPGLGHYSSLFLASEIADISRFKTAKKLCRYAGLASSTYQSADTLYHGHTIKEANKYIRYVLIEAIPKLIKKDYKMQSFYFKVCRRHGHKKAKIATARKLTVVIYHMLKNKTRYEVNRTLPQVNSSLSLGTPVALM